MSPPQNRAAIFASTVTFIALAAVAWDRLEYGAYTTWDEFSHWGRIGKALSASHALPTATTGILFKDAPPVQGRPPGTGLLQRRTGGAHTAATCGCGQLRPRQRSGITGPVRQRHN